MEPDSATNSLQSTPDACVRLMCSFGGRILPRPHDNQLRYVGGDTHIVAVSRRIAFSSLHAQLAALTASPEVAVKYQLHNEDLDALVSVTTDEDVENMMHEFDRLAMVAFRTPRLRLFLFPDHQGGLGSAYKGDAWYLDALNRSSGRLERVGSEASSVVSEIPDYLFGLDAPPAVAMVEPELNQYGPNEPSVPQYTMNQVWQYAQEPAPVYYMPGPVGAGNKPALPVQYFNQPAPGPVYLGSPPIRLPASGGVYNFSMGATLMAANVHEGLGDGGLMRSPELDPF